MVESAFSSNIVWHYAKIVEYRKLAFCLTKYLYWNTFLWEENEMVHELYDQMPHWNLALSEYIILMWKLSIWCVADEVLWLSKTQK